MNVVDVIRTIIQQNPKTWAWNYVEIYPLLRNKNGVFFYAESKFKGYVKILYNPKTDLFNVSFFENPKHKILERKDVKLAQLVHVIHKVVFKMKDSTDILMFCNSSN